MCALYEACVSNLNNEQHQVRCLMCVFLVCVCLCLRVCVSVVPVCVIVCVGAFVRVYASASMYLYISNAQVHRLCAILHMFS
jgi:hypothetical protein